MKREQKDREDLLVEGVNMPERGRLTASGDADQREIQYVIGWRRSGAVSVYCDAEPVFQFNADGHLRRVYWRDDKLAAQNGQFCRLQRTSDGSSRMRMVAIPMNEDEQAAVLSDWDDTAQAICDFIQTNDDQALETVGILPLEFRTRAEHFLDQVGQTPTIADSPNC